MAKKTKEELTEPIGGDIPLPGAENVPAKTATEAEEADDEVISNLVAGAEFFEFSDADSVFKGTYLGTDSVREKDGANAATNPNEKAGTVMGFNFVDDDGEMWIIGKSHQIEKAMDEALKVYKRPRLRIEFLGKTTNAKGQPVNRFKIDLLKGSK